MSLGGFHMAGLLSDDADQLTFEMDEFTVRRIDDGVARPHPRGARLHEAHGNFRNLPVGLVDM